MLGNSKIDIVRSINDLREIIASNPELYYCLYLAHKDSEGWDRSTSRVYMNNLFDNLVYQPVDIEKDDYDSLRAVYELSESAPNIVAINQTQPHKSNPVLKEYFKDTKLPTNVDAIVKNENGDLLPYDLNGPSFMGWYKDKVGSFENKTVIVLGVGGVGEPLARAIIKENPHMIYMIDPTDKSDLVDELSTLGNVNYYPDIENINNEALSDLVLINAAGKEGIDNQQLVEGFLQKFENQNYVFIDLRPHLNIPIVELAIELGWRGYTGHGMNARNDYVLVEKISKLIDVNPPSFVDFQNKVRDVS